MYGGDEVSSEAMLRSLESGQGSLPLIIKFVCKCVEYVY